MRFTRMLAAVAIVCSSLAPVARADSSCSAKEVGGESRLVRRVAMRAPKAIRGEPSILFTAASAGKFRTLVNALVAADLVKVLSGDGPFTVFAPTDEAFEALPDGALAALLKPENREMLAALLTYHVVPGKQTAKALVKHPTLETVNGARLTIKPSGHTLKVDELTVVKADIVCGNGIIHVIEKVLMPRKMDAVAVAEAQGSFKTLISALQATGLADALKGSETPLTILAPTDEAFAKLPAETLKSLLKPENREKLSEILRYHVIAGKVTARQAVNAGEARTLQGGKVAFDIRDGRLVVDDANVVATDIKTDTGIIHAIDRVLMPR